MGPVTVAVNMAGLESEEGLKRTVEGVIVTETTGVALPTAVADDNVNSEGTL